MKAMILAAGLGTRLRPLTLERAKPAIPLLGKPAAARLIEQLTLLGVDQFRLNLHHLPLAVQQSLESWLAAGAQISFSFEPQILGTAGGLKANESFFNDETFLMVNGDIAIDLPLAEAVAFHKARGALATLVLYPQQQPCRHFPVRIDKDGRLCNFKNARSDAGDPTPGSYVFTGVHVLETKIFDYIPPGRFYEINDQVYPEAIGCGERVLGFPLAGYWNDIGDPARYLEAQTDLMDRWGVSQGACISPDAKVAAGAQVGPYVSIGAGCVIEDDALVRDSIIWEHVRVEAGAEVCNSILAAGVTVHGSVRDRIVTRNGEAAIVRG
jgi:NDP-sugar pyrophosphorylase family protein